MHDRRSALRLGFGAAAAFCSLCKVGGARAAGELHWDYEGKEGPAEWGKMSPEWRACAESREESPIDLKNGVRSELKPLSFAYRPMLVHIHHNGHTIQVNCPPGSSQVFIEGDTYDLLQYHFHHPSEHILAGQRFDLELHFVHRDKDGHLAVVGVFIKPGAANEALQSLWSVLPTKAGPEVRTNVTLDPGRLLPAGTAFYRYYGSLTTPPCTDGILWSILKQPIEASQAQIRQFAEVFPNNARPVQPMNRRFLLTNG